MSQADLLRDAVALLDAAGIPHMVVGSYASTFHGEPRMTRDIDLVVKPSEHGFGLLVDLVDPDRFYMGDAMDAYIASAEDTMLAKLEWGKASGSDRQFDDAVAIAVAQEVDRSYLARWAPELGVVEQLGSVLARADSFSAGER